MPLSRPSLAALPPLPAGLAALFEQGTALVVCSILAGLLGLAPLVVRWRADQPRRERERIVNGALRDVAREDPERALMWRARLPPVASPFEPEPTSAEGPAPPAAAGPPGDPAAGGAGGTG
jgi:hypothetical protein